MIVEKSFQAAGARIHYAEGPASGVPLVLLHGLTGRWQTWLSVLPLFAFRYHTFALDLRGHGQSSHTPGSYELEHYGQDVCSFLRELVLEPAVLLGHSLGAEVALWVAGQAPDLVRAAMLEEPALYLIRDSRFEVHPIHHLISSLHDLLQTRPSVSEIAALVKTLVPEIDNAGALDWATALRMVDTDAMAQALSGRTVANCHPDEILPKIAAPVLLLQGNPATDGMLEDADVARVLAKLARCVHVYRLDVGHGIHGMIPMAFFQIVCSFLESL